MKKTLLAVIIIMSLAAAALAREGAQLILQKKDGTVLNGELLAVKHHCLILKDASGAGLTQDIDELAIIEIRKGSDLLAWTCFGLGAGTAIGAGIGEAFKGPTSGHANMFSSINETAMGALYGAIIGTVAGAIIGAATSIPKTVDLANESPEKIERTLVWLRSKARFPEESY